MTTIGRYQILEKLGQGGMGVVYRAFDTLLERVVALKVISTPIEDKPEVRERFVREARAAGQLSHPNIITIHDLGEHEGQPYLAMELLEGEDLLSRMARPERMSLRRKVELASDICNGLEFAHSRGLIHRDIKPANIFITSGGTLKILDFGLARLMTSELTGSNMMMGTLNYMAPEQIRGERIDHRVDIFSVGVVMYELLSGRKAFAGDSFASTLFKILNEVPEPLLRIDPTLPPDLVPVVERALSKPRDERYQNMGEMLRDLAVFRQFSFGDSPMSGRPISDRQRPPSDPARVGSGSGRRGSDPALGSGQTLTDRPATPSSPAPVLTPPPAPISSTGMSRGTTFTAAAAIVAVLAIAGLWLVFGRSSAEPSSAPPSAATPATPDVSAEMQQALDALKRADYPAVERLTDEVLRKVPNHPEAQRVRSEARSAAESVTRSLQAAQAHFAAGRFEEASKAAGEVLSIAPNHPEAQRILEEGASRSRGHGVEEARARMTRARTAARAANATTLASGSYRAASEAEREAQQLYQAGRLAQATSKFYEASGLYRSAEIAAQSTAAADAERRRVAEAERARKSVPAEPPPAPSPAPSVSSGAPVSALPPAVTPGLPPPPPPAPAPAAPPAPSPAPTTSTGPPPGSESSSRAAAEDAIRDLLAAYESALEGRSIDALKRLWPTLGGAQQGAIENEFRHANRIRVEIIEPRIAMSGGTATVNFLRRYELMTVDNQRLSSDTPATMMLRRADGNWIIESIRFDAPRRGPSPF
ncbi:MAG TPA: protein kinase [Vicinamibacterales bacterium]